MFKSGFFRFYAPLRGLP